MIAPGVTVRVPPATPTLDASEPAAPIRNGACAIVGAKMSGCNSPVKIGAAFGMLTARPTKST